jgi:hypothetical protein
VTLWLSDSLTAGSVMVRFCGTLGASAGRLADEGLGWQKTHHRTTGVSKGSSYMASDLFGTE